MRHLAMGYFVVLLGSMSILSGQALANEPRFAKGGAQYFVGAWHCSGKVILPGTSLAFNTTAHLQADSYNHQVTDHFRSTGILGLGASATGTSTWDSETKTLHRRATAGSDVAIDWINHGGWQQDTLRLEAKRSFWFSLHDVWLLDEFVRAGDDHFTHRTYYAKDSQHWAPFYIAECDRDI